MTVGGAVAESGMEKRNPSVRPGLNYFFVSEVWNGRFKEKSERT